MTAHPCAAFDHYREEFAGLARRKLEMLERDAAPGCSIKRPKDRARSDHNVPDLRPLFCRILERKLPVIPLTIIEAVSYGAVAAVVIVGWWRSCIDIAAAMCTYA